MDPKLFWTTFAAIFLAELGDKTQLATVGLSATASARWTIFLAASAALVLSTFLGVLAGGAFAQYIAPQVIRRLAGALFVVIGLALLLGRS